jgi:FHA domain
MDCTLKSIAGPENGQEFTAAGPETYIGRSQRCGVRLSSGTISFEHAVIHRAGDEFFIENLSANGTLLNNQRLSAKTRLKPRDQIRLGDQAILRVEKLPAVAGAGSGSRRALLVLLLVVMVFGGIAFLVLYNNSEPPAQDWQHAYVILQTLVDQEVAAGRLQPDTSANFREGWRMEVAGERASAFSKWLAVNVALSDYQARQGLQDVSASHKTALDHLLAHDKKSPAPTTEDLQAALDQFVTRIQHHPKIK